MIHVQIASQITAQGVHGVRWVLVEALDAPPAQPDLPTTALAGADAAPPAAEPPRAPVADALRLGALKVLAIGLGLGASLWTAAVQVGTPTLPALPSAAPAQRPADSAPPARAAEPTTPDTPAAPAAPAASAGLPRLTAGL